MPYHLAQANASRMRFPLDAPEMADFIALLDETNELADRSEGFVWRLKGAEGNYATDIRVFDDPRILFNMSVWTSVETLKAFTYRTQPHADVLRRRLEWFEPNAEASYALWWIPAGTLPTPEEGRARLEHIRRHGDSEHAFSFRALRRPPG